MSEEKLSAATIKAVRKQLASMGYRAMKKKHSAQEIQSWRLKGAQAMKDKAARKLREAVA